MKEVILMLHPTFGVLAILAGVWVFVEVLNAGKTTGKNNLQRIKTASVALVALVWLSYLFGGYWYVQYYGADKAIIKAGPLPSAHSFFMEVKEHLFFTLLLLSTYLPLTTAGNRLLAGQPQRNLVLTVALLIVLLGLFMEGAGATIGLGAKLGLLGR